jgi:hypothetical protein
MELVTVVKLLVRLKMVILKKTQYLKSRPFTKREEYSSSNNVTTVEQADEMTKWGLARFHCYYHTF